MSVYVFVLYCDCFINRLALEHNLVHDPFQVANEPVGPIRVRRKEGDWGPPKFATLNDKKGSIHRGRTAQMERNKRRAIVGMSAGRPLLTKSTPNVVNGEVALLLGVVGVFRRDYVRGHRHTPLAPQPPDQGPINIQSISCGLSDLQRPKGTSRGRDRN